jgi:hypothetical protein
MLANAALSFSLVASKQNGVTIIAKIKPGREDVIRAYGKKIEGAIAADPFVLAPLKLHYLRWVLFNIGSDTYFMYQGIFDTDFDKYTEDAITLFKQTGVDTVFENLDGFPMDWKTNAPLGAKAERAKRKTYFPSLCLVRSIQRCADRASYPG